MGEHGSDPSVRPGNFFATRRGFLFFPFLFDFFVGVFLCFFALALSPDIFPFLFVVSLFC